jgi:hypothetical protein
MKLAWLNTRDLPTLGRWFIRCGMIFCPFLCLLAMWPFWPFWRTGTTLPAAIWMCLLAIGCWGVATREANYRWVLILSPFATEAASIFFVPLRLTDIASAGWWSVVVYVSLFHVRSIRTYFDRSNAKSVRKDERAP